MENFYETFFYKSEYLKLIFISKFERKRTFGIASLNINRQKRNTFNNYNILDIHYQRIIAPYKILFRNISYTKSISFSLYSKASNSNNFDSISKNSYYSEDDKE